MTMQEKAIEAITQEQQKLDKSNKCYFVAEDLKELAGSLNDDEAKIFADDLAAGGLIQRCETAIKKYAKKNSGCCPGRMVPKILRKECGLPETQAEPAAPKAAPAEPAGRINILDMLDFM